MDQILRKGWVPQYYYAIKKPSAYRVKVCLKRHFVYCACATSFLHFDRLHVVTHVSSGDGKSVIFSVLIALSCGVQEELYILMISNL